MKKQKQTYQFKTKLKKMSRNLITLPIRILSFITLCIIYIMDCHSINCFDRFLDNLCSLDYIIYKFRNFDENDLTKEEEIDERIVSTSDDNKLLQSSDEKIKPVSYYDGNINDHDFYHGISFEEYGKIIDYLMNTLDNMDPEELKKLRNYLRITNTIGFEYPDQKKLNHSQEEASHEVEKPKINIKK